MIPIPIREKLRTEQATRAAFAYERGEYYYKKMKHSTESNGGNIFSCKSTRKFLQARKIYVHYCNEYQKHFGLNLIK